MWNEEYGKEHNKMMKNKYQKKEPLPLNEASKISSDIRVP